MEILPDARGRTNGNHARAFATFGGSSHGGHDATGAAPITMFSCINPRREQIRDTDAPEHFCADAVGDAVDDFRAVLRRIDMHAERPLAERHADHPNDRFGNIARVSVGGLKRGEALQRLIRQARIRPVVILRGTRLVAGAPE